MGSSPICFTLRKPDPRRRTKVKTFTREIQMKGIYKAVEVYEPGRLRVVERQVPEPGAGQVRIRVKACGICHTDAATVTGIYPGLTLPRVPGHEVVGRIEALGAGVSRWKIGQRVGVGLIGGEDEVCEPCRRGDIVNCQNPVVSGVTVDGGYAEVMIAEARGIASIPDELSSAEAAPLLCAGLTTYNALRNAGLRGGDLVAVQGIGGLGHLGIQFARRMGFRTDDGMHEQAWRINSNRVASRREMSMSSKPREMGLQGATRLPTQAQASNLQSLVSRRIYEFNNT